MGAPVRGRVKDWRDDFKSVIQARSFTLWFIIYSVTCSFLVDPKDLWFKVRLCHDFEKVNPSLFNFMHSYSTFLGLAWSLANGG